jgi:xylan 1,4-beta-xylosidase
VIRNPILPGFNADPPIGRVGGDYYIVTSAFEWFPGVQIHHPRDLLRRNISRLSAFRLRGNLSLTPPAWPMRDGEFGWARQIRARQ